MVVPPLIRNIVVPLVLFVCVCVCVVGMDSSIGTWTRVFASSLTASLLIIYERIKGWQVLTPWVQGPRYSCEFGGKPLDAFGGGGRGITPCCLYRILLEFKGFMEEI